MFVGFSPAAPYGDAASSRLGLAGDAVPGPIFTFGFNPRFYRRVRQGRFSTRLGSKDPGEKVTVTWDFSDEMFGGKVIVGAPMVTSVLKRARFPDEAAAAMVFAGPVVAGTLVMAGLGTGIHRNDYALRCEVDLSDGERLVQTYILPVRTA